jgi:hypothetical protein
LPLFIAMLTQEIPNNCPGTQRELVAEFRLKADLMIFTPTLESPLTNCKYISCALIQLLSIEKSSLKKPSHK